MTDAPGPEEAETTRLHDAVFAYHLRRHRSPGDPPPPFWSADALIETGLHLRASGDPALAERAFRDATRRYPNLPWPLIHLATTLRDRGAYDDARHLLAIACERHPDHLSANLEAAATLCRMGKLAEAERHLTDAVRWHPRASEAKYALAVLHRRLGRPEAARAALSGPFDAPYQYLVRIERALLEFASFADPAPLLSLIDETEADIGTVGRFLNDGFLHKHIPADILVAGSAAYIASSLDDDLLLLATGDVQDRIIAAVAGRRQFSLVRLSDGEGALLSYVDSLQHACAPPAALHGLVLGSEIWNTWLGKPIRHEDRSQLVGLCDALDGAVRRADIVGIPGIAHIGRTVNYIEYHGCVRAHRFVRARREHGLAETQINVRLQETGFYHRLLSEQDEISLLTCHPQLGDRLMERYPGLGVRSYLVPHQAGHGSTFGYALPSVPHFPDAYAALCAGIDVPAPGHVVLVAAGVFGKIYCDVVRERGGIGLDIGAMADAFSGFNTRRTIQDLLAAQTA